MKKSKTVSSITAFWASACAMGFAQASTITIPGGAVISLSEPPRASELSGFFSSFKMMGTIVSGLCTITALIFFVINLARLSTSVGNDMQRFRALKGILFSGLSLALFGCITVVVSIFWNAI